MAISKHKQGRGEGMELVGGKVTRPDTNGATRSVVGVEAWTIYCRQCGWQCNQWCEAAGGRKGPDVVQPNKVRSGERSRWGK